MTAAHRAGTAALLVLLAGGPLLAALPADVPAIRLAGVGLLWWYAFLVAPLLALGVAMAASLRGGGAGMESGALALWIGPALLAGVGAQAFDGGLMAPLTALAAMMAPLIAGLTTRAAVPSTRAAAVIAVLTVGLAVWANLVVAGDIARALGGPRWQGIAAGAAIALAVVCGPIGRAWRLPAIAGAVAALVATLALATATLGSPPWEAWRAAASRPAITFAPGSAWTVQGAAAMDRTAVTLVEAQQVTAVTAGTLRVVEQEPDGISVHDWALAAGDRLSLRAGDRVLLEPGLRLRFEPGARVPGATVSGVAWADHHAHTRDDIVRAAALVVTLSAGGVALLAAGGAGRVPGAAGAAVAMVAVVAACAWGVYAALLGPDLALGAPALVALLRLPERVVPGSSLGMVGALGLVAAVGLWATASATLRDRLVPLLPAAGRRGRGVLAAVLVVAATAGAAIVTVDAWRALVLALGFGATTMAAPALGGGSAGGRLAGAIIGGAVFVALGAAGFADGRAVLGEYPAVAAAPLAWAIAWVAGARRR
jgi:hypothetical protein